MDIQEAKEEIKRTLRAYTQKEPDGSHYRIPVQKQRPILLIGPPGIGKTAIMTQIAQEEQVGLVSYTMTHHTRQSAIGLPVLKEKVYGGKEYSVTEYTMSEIVAAIYDEMEETGQETGILFLDEINCVSETLAPVMLQLLQNKTFGSHPIPSGWLIVGAGNPPEYNRSVREMDVVTLDRVRYMDIQADLDIWRAYAAQNDIHPSIPAFLTVYPQSFYQIGQTELEKTFVTARGWEDLSCILYAYEEMGETVTEHLILQYLHSVGIAREFFLFYGLFSHYEQAYRENYPAATRENAEKLKTAGAGECMAVAAVLAAQVIGRAQDWGAYGDLTRYITQVVKDYQEGKKPCLVKDIDGEITRRKNALQVNVKHGLITMEEEEKEEALLYFLEEWQQEAEMEHAGPASAYILTERLDIRREKERELVEKAAACMEEAYALLEHVPVGAARQYFTAALVQDPACGRFLAEHPQEVFTRKSGELLVSRQEEELRRQVEQMV